MKDIEEIDMTLGILEGQDFSSPTEYKIWLMGNTNNEIVQRKCLIEGKVAYESLKNHAILGQINVLNNDALQKVEKIKLEITPISNVLSPIIPKSYVLKNNLLWRYVELYKFEDIITNKRLHYSRLDQFIDNLEGQTSFTGKRAIASIPNLSREQKLTSLKMYNKRMQNNRQNSFACCWHINDRINYSLWQKYGSEICIKTSASRLEIELEKTKIPFLNEPVQYFDEPYFNQNAYWFPALFKRNDFNHEKEFRSIIFVKGFDLKFGKIKINPQKLISKIYIHPDKPKAFYLEIKKMVRENGMDIPVIWAQRK